MRHFFLFLLLVGCALSAPNPYQPQGSPGAVTQKTAAGTVTPTVNGNGPYVFRWETQTLTADYINRPEILTVPGAPGPESSVGAIYSTAVLQANPSDSNNIWLRLPTGGFPVVDWFNNTNSDLWGPVLGKGYFQTDFMYESTYAYTASKLLFQLNGKCILNLAYDSNDGVALRTTTVGGGSTPGIGTMAFYDPTPQTKKTIVYRWNRSLANPNNLRTSTLYLIESGGATHRSSWDTGVVAQPKCSAWHQMQMGNDTSGALDYWMTNIYVGTNWDFDLPVNLWQDFEFSTIDTTNLLAAAHSPYSTWSTVGSLSGFSTTTGAQLTSPCSINLWQDTGTKGLRRDLSVTAGGGVGFTFSGLTTLSTVGMIFRSANLATGTNVWVLGAAGATPPAAANDYLLIMRQTNVGGQQKLELYNGKTFTASATNVDITAGTTYGIAMAFSRNGTGKLRVYDMATKTQVGSEVTIACPNNSITGWWVGSYSNITAQASGVFYDVDNLVYDINGQYWPLTFWE